MTRTLTTDLEMLARWTAPSGKEVLDVGCGGGSLVRELTALGASATGVEISESQLAPALARDRPGAARYLVGRAQALPLEDGSVDVVVFMRTLHHVPPPDLARALGEARRVVRRDGVVYVAEPLPEGDFFALTSLVEDELAVRRAAQEAIRRASEAGLERTQSVEYEVRSCLAGMGALRARIVSVDPGRAEVFDARRAELADAFERLGEPGTRPGERCFVAPMRADVLRPAGA